MERKNYNYIPPHYLLTSHHHLQSLLTENQLLTQTVTLLKHQLSAAKTDLRRLSAVAGEITAAREVHALEVEEMEDEVRLMIELRNEFGEMVGELKELRCGNEGLEAKVNDVVGEVRKVSGEWRRSRLVKEEIKIMKNEIERGRGLIEHEKKVYASNNKQKQEMDKYKIIMARKIEKMKVEAVDAEKRARAAAAVEAAFIPGIGYAAGYQKPEMRGLIEHEKKVYASNIKQKQEREKYKVIMARKIEKMKVEATDAAKRARAAAAVEAAFIPGIGYAAGYEKTRDEVEG